MNIYSVIGLNFIIMAAFIGAAYYVLIYNMDDPE